MYETRPFPPRPPSNQFDSYQIQVNSSEKSHVKQIYVKKDRFEQEHEIFIVLEKVGEDAYAEVHKAKLKGSSTFSEKRKKPRNSL
ncbi:18834_t:CDS:2 [Gigaspora margarita]|uniref:18834_t:CDS:1 n=1 Tax=Gigaspora margarita TaxID=4874 RepID=A0ABM8W279_GIGMA|nr:18834_t:CDS:2 [Gigaspora margarita]